MVNKQDLVVKVAGLGKPESWIVKACKALEGSGELNQMIFLSTSEHAASIVFIDALIADACAVAGAGAGAGAAAAGPVMPRTPEERVKLLVDEYGDALPIRLAALHSSLQPGNLGQRAGSIARQSLAPSPLVAAPSTSATAPAAKPEIVQPIGQYFKLHGLRRPAVQLFQLLLSMDQRFLNLTRLPKAQQGIQLLRLVAGPGVGKSTALFRLWPELYDFVQEHWEGLRDMPMLAEYQSHWQGSMLAERVRSSLKPERMLVFVMDLSKQGLNMLAHSETTLTSPCVLALRMLYSALHDSASATSYNEFLDRLSHVIPLGKLEPLDILKFIKSASGLGADEHSLVVFAFDEANTVTRPAEDRPSWLQELFSSFVVLRCSVTGLNMMPLLIAASTLASATTFDSTSSGKSEVADVQLLPLSLRDMQAIVLDVHSRLEPSSAATAGSCGLEQHVVQVLKFLGGNPRHLAWALACMSGSSYRPMDEMLLLGEAQACPWLSDARAFKLSEVLDKLASSVDGWLTWLNSDKAPLLNQLVAHAMLGRGVGRAGIIPHMAKITWQQAENAGVCLLIRTDGTPSADSPASSRNSSAGGGGAGFEGPEADDAQRSSTVAGVLRSAMLHEAAASSTHPENVPDHFVWLPPLLAVLALRKMGVDGRSMLGIPLCQFVDDWRNREFTDILMLLLKFQLLSSVMKEEVVLLSKLLPGKLPEEFSQVQIVVPPSIKRPSLHQQLTEVQFKELCEKASYGTDYAFIGPGNSGPDSWLVLQVADGGGGGGGGGDRLLLFLQSKKRTVIGKAVLKGRDLDAEAAKCWGCPVNCRRLMVYVTDQRTSGVGNPYEAAEKTGGRSMWVSMIGPEEQERFYSSGLKFVKRSMELEAVFAKQPRVG